MVAERVRVDDREPAAREHFGQAERTTGDDRRVLAGGRDGPRKAGAIKPSGGAEPRRGEPADALASVGQDRIGHLVVERTALLEAARELRPVLRERPRRTLAPLPGGLLGDPAPDGEAAGERIPDALRHDRPTAQRDQTAAAKRLDRQPLLGLAKACLAVALEDLGGRGAQLALDLRVEVHDRLAQDRRGALRRSCLARPHEPDEGHRGERARFV